MTFRPPTRTSSPRRPPRRPRPPPQRDRMRLVCTKDLTIADGESLSGVLTGSVLAVFIPSAFTGTEITFQVAMDEVNFFDLHNDIGDEVALFVVPGAVTATLTINHDLHSFPYLKIR